MAALGCSAPRRIPAKSVNYFYGNMKDARFGNNWRSERLICSQRDFWNKYCVTQFNIMQRINGVIRLIVSMMAYYLLTKL